MDEQVDRVCLTRLLRQCSQGIFHKRLIVYNKSSRLNSFPHGKNQFSFVLTFCFENKRKIETVGSWFVVFIICFSFYDDMTTPTQLILNRLVLPTDVLILIKDYLFHTIQKIDKRDERYNLLMKIPPKEVYDDDTEITVVGLRIKPDRYYFLSYNNRYKKTMLELFVYESTYPNVQVYEETTQSRILTDYFYNGHLEN